MRLTELNGNATFPSMRDFLSFEFIFIVSVFAGTYKGHAVLENANLFMDITVLTCLISMVFGFFVFIRRPFVQKEKMVFLFVYFAFIVYVLLSWNWHGLPGERVLKLQKFIVFNTWSLCGPILIIGNRTRILRFLKFVVVMGGVMLVDLFWQLIETGGTIHFASAFDGSSNYHAIGRIVSVSFFILVYYYAFVLSNIKCKRLVKIIVLSFCILYAMGIFFSISKGAIVSWCLASGLFVLLGLSRQRYRRSIAPIMTLIGVITLLVVYLIITDPFGVSTRIIQRFNIVSQIQHGEYDRIIMYKEAIELFRAHPFFGIGWDMWNPGFSYFWSNRHPHNIFLEVLTELGIMGLIIFLAIFTYPFWKMKFSFWVKDDLALLLLIALIYNLFVAQMSGDLTDNRFLFTSLGLMISYSSQIKLCNRYKRLLPKTSRFLDANSMFFFPKTYR